MIYKKFQNLQLSALGLGMMRLPTDQSGAMDEAAAFEMIDYAYKNGINYFDTAWGYHGGNSELICGKFLSRYPRDTYYLATKFPGYDNSNFGKAEEIFEEQLKKCNTDYFDFYLFHCVSDNNIDLYLDPQYKTYAYLAEQKKKGRIRHLGFSSHCSCDTLVRFIKAYGDILEFAQLQLNYMDWHYQNAEEKYNICVKAGLPVWIMEPVRGGKLVNVSDEMKALMQKLRPEESVVGWSFRFLQALPAVSMVLSGMSDMKQLSENIKIFSEQKPLTLSETEHLLAQIDLECKNAGVPCTKCNYCVSHCPQNLNIPELIALYNDRKSAYADCIQCKCCEQVCPQCIQISKIMQKLS